MQTGPPKVRRY